MTSAGLLIESEKLAHLREIYLSLINHPGQLSLAISKWVGAMSTGQRAVMLSTGSEGR